jgi:hypothetical protein
METTSSGWEKLEIGRRLDRLFRLRTWRNGGTRPNAHASYCYFGFVFAPGGTGARARILTRAIATLGLAVSFLAIPLPAIAAIGFIDVTNVANIDYSGLSFGAAWGDLDGDGLPDLWVGNHSASPPNLYRNNGDETFADVGLQNWNGALGDPHGVAWADFDNDGDQDLYETHGGCCLSRLYVNDGTQLHDQAIGFGVDYQTGRGRTPTWFDVDRDGALDLVLANAFDAVTPTTIFRQVPPSSFEDVSSAWGVPTGPSPSAQLASVDGDKHLELIFNGFQGPARIFATSGGSLLDVSSFHPVPTTSGVRDIALGDFNGDLITDFFYARTASEFDVVQTDANTIAAQLVTAGDEQPFSFTTAGVITVEVGPSWRESPSDIFVGAAGTNPSGLTFDVDPTQPSSWGLMPHAPGSIDGLFIGFTPATSVWTVARSSIASTNIYLRIRSTEAITNSEVVWNKNYVPTIGMLRILNWGDGTYSKAWNSAYPSACVSATAQDFDNDMDLDVYMACTGAASNIDNMLFENDGNGNFSAAPNAGGAAGSNAGRADLVVAADYNLDGYVDVFVVNGLGPLPLADGPHQLFRNNGGANHWIQIDLEGTLFNRDGIGARILLEAGGITQLREQRGGIHNYAQDFQRVHFGLGANVVADRITIQWPSGVLQVLEDVSADQVVRVVEGRGTPVPLTTNWLTILIALALVGTGSIGIRSIGTR